MNERNTAGWQAPTKAKKWIRFLCQGDWPSIVSTSGVAQGGRKKIGGKKC